MKRELKFRAWLKAQKKIVEIENIHKLKAFPDNTFYFDSKTMEQDSVYLHSKDFELMQLTGLKDKNGKEIYEHDILHCEHWKPKNHQVIFREGGFCLADKNNKFISDINMIQDSKGIHFEIIGNIYENSDLLS